VMPPVWLLECEACVRVGTFFIGVFIGVLGDSLFGWGVEFFT